MKKFPILIFLCLLSPPTHAVDVLDPKFYEEEPSVKEYISKISKDVENGINLAEEFKIDIGTIRADQVQLNRLSLGNSYKIRVLELKQSVIDKRVEILEKQDKETRKLLSLLSQGVEKSLRFVNGVYGLLGWLAGVSSAVCGGLMFFLIKKYLNKKKRLD